MERANSVKIHPTKNVLSFIATSPLFYSLLFCTAANMGRAKTTRKFAQVKRLMSQRDSRLKKNVDANKDAQKKPEGDQVIREM
jgi:hypothetical protein